MFRDATTGWCPSKSENESRKAMTCQDADLGSGSDWLCRKGKLLQPIRRPTHIWVVTRHQCGISARPSGAILQGNQWWCRQMSSAFSGLIFLIFCLSYFRSEAH